MKTSAGMDQVAIGLEVEVEVYAVMKQKEIALTRTFLE